MSQPKPWYRKQTRSWYVQLGKKQINLGRVKSKALKEYHRLMAEQKATNDLTVVKSIASVFRLYQKWCEDNLEKATVDKNNFHIQRFLKYVDQDLEVAALKPHVIQSWVDSCYKNRSSTYKHTAISVIQGVFRWALEVGHIDHNPVSTIKKPKRNVREFFLPLKDWPIVIEGSGKRRFKELVTVMLNTGARPQEIRKIESRHFDAEFSRIVFPIDESKGKRRARLIYLNQKSYPIVESLTREFPTGPIFRNARKKPWTANSLSTRFRRLRKKLGIQGLCAYSLRHSFAHCMLTQGVDSHVVSKLLGHSDGRLLFNRYGHIEQDSKFMADAVDVLNSSSTES